VVMAAMEVDGFPALNAMGGAEQKQQQKLLYADVTMGKSAVQYVRVVAKCTVPHAKVAADSTIRQVCELSGIHD
jgi:hypothetical protein